MGYLISPYVQRHDHCQRLSGPNCKTDSQGTNTDTHTHTHIASPHQSWCQNTSGWLCNSSGHGKTRPITTLSYPLSGPPPCQGQTETVPDRCSSTKACHLSHSAIGPSKNKIKSPHVCALVYECGLVVDQENDTLWHLGGVRVVADHSIGLSVGLNTLWSESTHGLHTPATYILPTINVLKIDTGIKSMLFIHWVMLTVTSLALILI